MATALPRAATGIGGLDDVLNGGFIRNRLYLIEGMPWANRTAGTFRASTCASSGRRKGCSTRSSNTRCSTPRRSSSPRRRRRSSRTSSGSTRRASCSIRSPSCACSPATRCATGASINVQSICHGAVMLEHTLPTFGVQRRRVSVTKYRGSAFRGGYHDYVIRRGGLLVFPRLVAAEHRRESRRDRLQSGLAELDKLLGGGIERGTSTLLSGAAGTGKSTLASLFAASAAARGENATLFIFDESANTLFSRMSGLGIGLRKHVTDGRLVITEVDPAQLTPGEFGYLIRQAVDKHNSSIVVIDSLNGYLNSMPDEKFLVVQLHEILTYLGQQGVASILIAAHQGIISSNMASPVDASYLADAAVLLRYFEAEGEVRQAISVVKKRGGSHERTLREFRMQDGRITVGEPLRSYRGVLSGIPEKQQ